VVANEVPATKNAEVKRSRRFLIGYLLAEAVVLCLVGGGIWYVLESPRLRYRVVGDETSLRAVLKTLRRGDSIEEVRSLLGDRYYDPESEYSMRRGLHKLVDTYPDVFPQGLQETDIILVYSTRTFRYGLQFRDRRLIGTCGQRGAKILPPSDPTAHHD